MDTTHSATETYHQLCAYTLSHTDPSFIHQHVVDAFAAQYADDNTKPIQLTFALVGLYLHAQRGFSGKQVQRVHTLLARRRREWPTFVLPEQRGEITVYDVIDAPAGAERDAMIHAWSNSVWDAYRASHAEVMELVRSALD